MKNTAFNKLNVGDEVLFYPRSVLSPPEHAHVEKITSSRVLIRGIYFDRKKGYACGHGQDAYPPVIQLIKKGAAAETNSPFTTLAGEAPRVVLNRMLEQLADLETKIVDMANKIEEEPAPEPTPEAQPVATESEVKQEA
jgi:hypothetical protein